MRFNFLAEASPEREAAEVVLEAVRTVNGAVAEQPANARLEMLQRLALNGAVVVEQAYDGGIVDAITPEQQ